MHAPSACMERVLVLCLQASGCSIFASILGQATQTLTAVDAAITAAAPSAAALERLCRRAAPPPKTFILKMTLRGVYAQVPGLVEPSDL